MKQEYLAVYDRQLYESVEESISDNGLALVRKLTSSDNALSLRKDKKLIVRVLDALNINNNSVNLVIVEVEEFAKIETIRIV